LERLEEWVHGDLQPDLTLLFDVPEDIAGARLAAARAPDKFEREKVDFHARVRAAYLDRARRFSERIQIIDGSRDLDAVRATVRAVVASHLPR
jgi:dTMP kinase